MGMAFIQQVNMLNVFYPKEQIAIKIIMHLIDIKG